MGKIRKNVRRKTFQYQKNRKRMNKNAQKLPKNACKIIEDKWNRFKSTALNMRSMGLSYDANRTLGIKRAHIMQNLKPKNITIPEVVETLEHDATPKPSGYKLTKNQVEFITEMLDKHGENYRKMALDKKNHAQFTWKQLRKKVNDFKSIPEQYNKFLEDRKNKEIDTSAVNTCEEDDGEW